MNDKEVSSEILECGTSLAEREHHNDPETTTTITSTHKPGQITNRHGLDVVDNQTDDGNNLIESFRSLVASDVITNNSEENHSNNNHTTISFTSPFEIPPPETEKKNHKKKNSKYNDSCSNKKYLSVPLIYCDHTASNRHVKSIEQYLQGTCLPFYGNTHTNTSITGSQSTAFVAEARQIVAESTNAKITGKASLDVVLFAGNGATSAVELLIDCLGLKYYNTTNNTNIGINHNYNHDHRPVVFIGPYEHHSNLLPWRESGCEIVMIPECRKTQTIDYHALEQILRKPEYNNGRFKMGTFTAASNITGKVCDDIKLSSLLHQYNTLAFFDYATGAPYLNIDMNPASSLPAVYKDAVLISPHKMMGGIGTPGILIIKKQFVNQQNAPHRSGGGTVFYVTNQHHRFLSNRIERYEGGTPNIMGIMRIGLTFLFKRKVEEQYRQLVTRKRQQQQHQHATEKKSELMHPPPTSSPPPSLLEYEYSTYDHAVRYLKQHAPNLVMLGTAHLYGAYGDDNIHNNKRMKNLPIFSFLIKCGKRFLHFNFVCAVLNDLFGIQSRGGCQCAGPYSQRLLGLTETIDGTEVPNKRNQQIENALINYKERAELLRPGFTRISLPFKGLRQEEVDYVLKALVWIARNGWALMCNYRCNHRTGEWRHFTRQGKPLGRTERKWLSHYDILQETPTIKSISLSTTATAPSGDSLSLQELLETAISNANAILRVARSDSSCISQVLKMSDVSDLAPEQYNNKHNNEDKLLEELRWYVYPKDCAFYLSQGLMEFPETDSKHILGAIIPFGFLFSTKSPSHTIVTTATTLTVNQKKDSDVAGDQENRTNAFNNKERCYNGNESTSTTSDAIGTADDGEQEEKAKRRSADENISSKQIHRDIDVAMGKEKGKENLPTNQSLKSKLLFFRDGEHTGEALLDDIEAGFVDGELSDKCEIFDQKSGCWVSIVSFFQKAGKNLEEEMSIEIAPRPAVRKTNNKVNGKKDDNDKNITDKDTSHNNKHIDLKNQQKKPSRDSSTWGQAHFAASIGISTADAAAAKVKNGQILQADENISTDTVGRVEDTAASVSPQQLVTNPKIDLSSAAATIEKPCGKKRKKFKHVKPPPKMMRLINQAMMQWDMIEDGDRLLLGLSGGKDSLSLLHCLLEYKRKMPIRFDLEVCTIDPMTPSFDPSPLIPYVESLDLKYHYIKSDIVARANICGRDGKMVSSLCAFCARMKRGSLYTCARENNCNKLVLAQHLDDCAESFMMSVMHNGFLRTMKANYKINAGDLSVIRPMVYCRESLMTEFAKSENLPVINENCPACFEEPKERARIKKLLSREETMYSNFYDNIRRSLIPLMHNDSQAIMHCYTEETVAKSRKNPHPKHPSPSPEKSRKKQRNHHESSSGSNKNYVEKVTTKNGDNTDAPTMVDENGQVSVDRDADYEKVNPSECLLSNATEEELIKQLAKKRAERFQLAGAMRGLDNGENGYGENDHSPLLTCTLNNGCAIME